MPTPPNPLLIPTLTEVVAEGVPALLITPDINPANPVPSLNTANAVINASDLAEQVMQIIAPQIEEIVKTAILQALQEHKRGG